MFAKNDSRSRTALIAFNIQMYLFFQDDSESPNPIIHLDTGKKTWTVHFDGLVINDVVDFTYALAIILSLHWVFNIQFERSVNNTLHFLSICIGKI